MKNKNEIDWIIHKIINDYGPGNLTNAHTHGMARYNHLDFQVVLNLPPEHVGYLLNSMGARVQNGERFHAGNMIYGLYDDCPVRLDEFRETGRSVLRLIIPDKYNLFPENPHCMDTYKYQIMPMFEE